jgi:hypothetical protein
MIDDEGPGACRLTGNLEPRQWVTRISLLELLQTLNIEVHLLLGHVTELFADGNFSCCASV